LQSSKKEVSVLKNKGEFSSVGSEHLPYKQRVTGSNPVTPTLNIKGLHQFKGVALFLFAFYLHAFHFNMISHEVGFIVEKYWKTAAGRRYLQTVLKKVP
jgi:hypothetical protein